MNKAVRIVAAAVTAVMMAAALSWIGWRLLSRWRLVPCPPWLSWLLENRLTEGVGGKQILDHLHLQPGMNVLDVGCGSGRLTIPAAQRVSPGGTVTALDVQPGMLRRVRRKARQAGVDNVVTLQARTGDDVVEKSRYDRALLVTVLGEIPDRETALREIFDALKPGGRLATAEVLYDPHYQLPSTVRTLAGRIGFVERLYTGRWVAYVLIFEKPQ